VWDTSNRSGLVDQVVLGVVSLLFAVVWKYEWWYLQYFSLLGPYCQDHSIRLSQRFWSRPSQDPAGGQSSRPATLQGLPGTAKSKESVELDVKRRSCHYRSWFSFPCLFHRECVKQAERREALTVVQVRASCPLKKEKNNSRTSGKTRLAGRARDGHRQVILCRITGPSVAIPPRVERRLCRKGQCALLQRDTYALPTAIERGMEGVVRSN
jgi:hypothetical protein